jgi:hypothetical protein
MLQGRDKLHYTGTDVDFDIGMMKVCVFSLIEIARMMMSTNDVIHIRNEFNRELEKRADEQWTRDL